MINTFRVFCLFVFLCVSATPVFGQNKKNNGLTVSGSVGSSGTSVSVSTGSGGKTSSVDKKKRPEKPPRQQQGTTTPRPPSHNELRYGMKPTDSLRYGVVPDRQNESTRPPKRPHHPDRLRPYPRYPLCPPYCDGIVYEYENEPETGSAQAAAPAAPERSFSPGVFEPFDDPRDRWAEDEVEGQNADSGSLDYYQRMMRAW